MRNTDRKSIQYLHACMLSHFGRVRPFETQWTIAHQVPLMVNSPGKNTGMGHHALLQGIFPGQGWNMWCLGLPALARMFFTLALPVKPI